MAIQTILVEDNEQIRASLIPTMQELADLQIVEIAETQSDAKQAVALHPDWELIVIDLFLREGSGLGVLRECKERRSNQVALVLTNYPTDEMRRRCFELGADGLYDKSLELDAFVERCAALVPGGPAPSREP